MSKNKLDPGLSKMVNDFDNWLMHYVSEGLDKKPFEIIKDITGKWRELRRVRLDFLIDQFDKIKNKSVFIKKKEG